MTTGTLSAEDTKVSEALVAEINSIKEETSHTDGPVTYAPQAWTREGHTD